MSGVDPALEEFRLEVGESGPVAARGAGTRFDLGGPLTTGTRLVSAPAGIIDHAPEEMTVRVRAGTTVAELHAELATASQRTALPERGGTVGGALAVGENDVAVLGRGRVRDAALQLRYVSAQGTLITGGGPTVKNVSGFDLPRLFVGSLGTLGLLGEAILRTNPIPAVSRWFRSSDADPFAVTDAVLRPAAILWDGCVTVVQLEGHAADVEASLAALAALGGWSETDGPPVLPPHRWSLRPSELRGLDGGALGSFVASVGVGTLFASVPQPEVTPSPQLEALTEAMRVQFDPTGRLSPGRSIWSQG